MRIGSRRVMLAAFGVLALGTPVLGVTAGTLTPVAHAAAGTCNAGPGSYDDFDHDGLPDFVVGVPNETLAGKEAAGRVEIRYGNGTSQGLSLPAPAADDQTGAAIATFALGEGACDGLLVGAPGRRVDGHDQAGAVAVFLHAADDPSGKPVFRLLLDQSDLAGAVQTDGSFGYTLATGPVDTAAGSQPVYVGAPGYNVGAVVDAGAVVRTTLTADAAGAIVPAPGELLAEGAAPVGGTPGDGDQFGIALGADGAVIGAPGKSVGTRHNAGAAYVRVDDGTYRQVTQNTDGVPGTAEAGDQFGATVLRAADQGATVDVVGSPGEAIGTATGAGSVTVLGAVDTTGAVTGAHAYSQGKDGIPGAAERGDHFGAALGGVPAGGFLAGVPDEDVGTVANAGAVARVGGAAGGVRSWSQNTAGVPGTAEAGDRFGAALGSYGTRVLVGAYGEDAFAGLVIDGLPGLTPTSKAVVQSSGTAEAGDWFGATLSTNDPT